MCSCLGPEDTLKSCRKISKLSIMMVIISIIPSGTIVSIVAVILNHLYIYVGLPNIALPMPQFTGPKEALEMAPLHWGLLAMSLRQTPFSLGLVGNKGIHSIGGYVG